MKRACGAYAAWCARRCAAVWCGPLGALGAIGLMAVMGWLSVSQRAWRIAALGDFRAFNHLRLAGIGMGWVIVLALAGGLVKATGMALRLAGKREGPAMAGAAGGLLAVAGVVLAVTHGALMAKAGILAGTLAVLVVISLMIKAVSGRGAARTAASAGAKSWPHIRGRT